MNSNLLRIGIDIDGVLIDTDGRAYLNFCEQELGWTIDYDAFEHTHSWPAATGQTSREVIGDAFKRFLEEVEEAQKPIEGAHDALKQLAARADIYLITSRVGMLLEVTEEFLAAHLPDVRYRELSMDNHENKAQKIIDFGVDYFIDDSYHEISLILQNPSVDTHVIPFPGFHGQPDWQGLTDPRIHWLSVWQDIKSGLSLEQQASIRHQAWEEIAHTISEAARVQSR